MSKSWIALALLALAGCGSTRTSHVITGHPALAHNGDVAIVMEGSPVAVQLEEIAILQARGSGTNSDLAHVIEGLKREARQLGCDSVVHVKIDQGASLASATGVCVRGQY